ncbi:A-kinase anchor protein 12-like [Acipenser oxyrinchus oxyrinchus]|uniref:A-kinase anchor protein 12-like n=1 Tax=Acipenser oxyrinchus oxyrinchus TaxID=40147 RepID=A0AAD8GC80_ACIOX|nr:A-kinase anchor protein 12-like [Acipenser oxyrinchus oxyrinchus]
MGAATSAERAGKSEEDATTNEEQSEAVDDEIQEGDEADAKLLQKNGQISSLNGKPEDQEVELNGETEQLNVQNEEQATAEVGQSDSTAVSQKEEVSEKMETVQDEVVSQVNGEKEKEKDSLAENNESLTEEKTEKEEKPSEPEANEVGFKKVFKFVGFKFTLKKDKNEKTEPVQLLTVKNEEGEASTSEVTEESKAEAATEETKPSEEEESAPEEKDVAETATEPVVAEVTSEKINGEASEKPEEAAEVTETVKEPEKPAESPTSPALQETQSPLKRFFSQGLFSNLRKKTSFKKPKEEEQPVVESTEAVAEEETNEPEVKEEEVPTEVEKKIEDTATVPQLEQPATQKVTEATEEVSEPTEKELEAAAEQKTEKVKSDVAAEGLVAVPEIVEEKVADLQSCVPENKTEAEVPEVKIEAEQDKVTKEEVQQGEPADESKPTAETVKDAVEQTIPEDSSTIKLPQGVTTEAELLSSQEKAKLQGSPLKKLFNGTGLKKLSGKKHKGKKEEESKLTESCENGTEQLQSSTGSAEGQKIESLPSSPEESTENVVADADQTETGLETEGDGATSDGERKKDGITPWASFKKMVTSKKRVKRPSESDKEDESIEKPKSATMSSTESSTFAEKQEVSKANEEELNLEPSTEEPKKKVDTSVSWEALICVGSSKKRTRKTSDSDDESPKLAVEVEKSVEESEKSKDATAESPITSSQEADHEQACSSPEQAGSPSDGEGVSTWESFKRLVTPRRKPKLEDKSEESVAAPATEQVPSDSEVGKEESSFSLKKLMPGRKKKRSDAKQEHIPPDEARKEAVATETGEEDFDTPAVVPLSEYDTADPEQVEIVLQEETTVEVKQLSEVQIITEEAKPAAAAITQETKAVSEEEKPVAEKIDTVEERSPSWISATVTEEIIAQRIESISTHQQLSDIAEEVLVEDPVSAVEVSAQIIQDDTIAEDIVELTSEAVTAFEQVHEESFAEETEMVSAVSQLNESAATSGDVTPVLVTEEYEIKKTEGILLEVAERVKLTPVDLSVTEAATTTEEAIVATAVQVVESAVKEDVKADVEQKDEEAVAYCTGLATQGLEAVEKSLPKTTVEVITVMDAISTELIAEQKPETLPLQAAKEFIQQEIAEQAKTEVVEEAVEEIETKVNVAEIKGDPESQITKAVEQIFETSKEPLVEQTLGEVSQIVEIEIKKDIESVQPKVEPEPAATSVVLEEAVEGQKQAEISEPETEIYEEETTELKLAQQVELNGVQAEFELYEEQLVIANTPLFEAEGPAEATVEELICTHHVEVTEKSAIEEQLHELAKVQEAVDVHQVPAEEVIHSVPQEVTASMTETPATAISKVQEAQFAVTAAAIEEQVVKETVSIIDPPSETVKPDTVKVTTDSGKALSVKFKDVHESTTVVEHTVAETAAAIVEAVIEAATSGMPDENLIHEHFETLDTKTQAVEKEHVIQTVAIEKQSTMIVQEIIQNVVENFTEKASESEVEIVVPEVQDAPEIQLAAPEVALPENQIQTFEPQIEEEIMSTTCVENTETQPTVIEEAEKVTKDHGALVEENLVPISGTSTEVTETVLHEQVETKEEETTERAEATGIVTQSPALLEAHTEEGVQDKTENSAGLEDVPTVFKEECQAVAEEALSQTVKGIESLPVEEVKIQEMVEEIESKLMAEEIKSQEVEEEHKSQEEEVKDKEEGIKNQETDEVIKSQEVEEVKSQVVEEVKKNNKVAENVESQEVVAEVESQLNEKETQEVVEVMVQTVIDVKTQAVEEDVESQQMEVQSQLPVVQDLLSQTTVAENLLTKTEEEEDANRQETVEEEVPSELTVAGDVSSETPVVKEKVSQEPVVEVQSQEPMVEYKEHCKTPAVTEASCETLVAEDTESQKPVKEDVHSQETAVEEGQIKTTVVDVPSEILVKKDTEPVAEVQSQVVVGETVPPVDATSETAMVEGVTVETAVVEEALSETPVAAALQSEIPVVEAIQSQAEVKEEVLSQEVLVENLFCQGTVANDVMVRESQTSVVEKQTTEEVESQTVTEVKKEGQDQILTAEDVQTHTPAIEVPVQSNTSVVEDLESMRPVDDKVESEMPEIKKEDQIVVKEEASQEAVSEDLHSQDLSEQTAS